MYSHRLIDCTNIIEFQIIAPMASAAFDFALNSQDIVDTLPDA